MSPDELAGLTAGDVRRWLRGLQLFHAVRLAVAAVIGASFIAAIVPSVCTPEQPCAFLDTEWWLALFPFSLVLLPSAPELGFLSAFALGVLGAGYAPALSARGWWAAEAALSVAALVFLLMIRVHQDRVAATIARRIAPPGGRTATSATWGGLRARFVLRARLANTDPDDLLSLSPARVWWAHRRIVDGDLRGILVSTRWPSPVADAEISAADGSGLRLCVLRSPVPARRIAEHAKDWTPPELVIMTGQLWYGGVVQVYAPDGEPLAEAIVGLPQLTLLRSWFVEPAQSTFEDENFIFEDEPADSNAPMVVDVDAPAGAPVLSPFTAHRPHRRLMRWIGWSLCVAAVATLGLLVAPIPNEMDWVVPWISFLFGWLGLNIMRQFAHAHVAVGQDGVTVVNSWSTYRIPWGALDEVELGPLNKISDNVRLVFTTPEEVVKAESPMGLASPLGEMAALVNRIVDYRDRTRDKDAQTTTALMVTGAAAHWRRRRPPVSDPLPPTDTARASSNAATAARTWSSTSSPNEDVIPINDRLTPGHEFVQVPVETQGSNGLAVAGFVLALLGALSSFIPLVNIGGDILALVGLILGIIGLVPIPLS